MKIKWNEAKGAFEPEKKVKVKVEYMSGIARTRCKFYRIYLHTENSIMNL